MLKKLLFLYLIIIVAFTGCNEEPTNLGINLLQDTIIVKAISSDSIDLMTDYEVYRQKNPLFNSGATLVGAYEDMEAVSFLRFGNIPDSLAYLTEADIESCIMEMHPYNYAFGDFKNSNLSFKLKEVHSEWTINTRYDDFKNNESAYLGNEYLAEWQGAITLRDSIPSISFDFPKRLVVDWLNTAAFNADTNNVMDTIWGVALLPQPESNVIHRFQGLGLGASGSGNYTTIKTVYNNKEGQSDTLVMTVAIENSLFNAPAPEENEIMIQGGVSYRTKLDFDVSSLPDLSSIHKSELILHYNQKKSFWGSRGPDSVIALRLYNEIAPDDFTILPVLEWSANLSKGTTQYRFESISSAIETWNRTVEKKGSLILLAMPTEQESRQIDRMVFYGPDDELGPQIKIIYSYIETND